MSSQIRDAVIAEVARALVAQVVPQELPLFRAISGAYFAAPDKPIKFEGGKDNPLGFGTGSSVSVATPAILTASNVVVTYVASAIGASDSSSAQSLFGKVSAVEAQQASNWVLAAAQFDRTQLRMKLDSLFSLDDILALCFDLGIDSDNLSGDTKQGKVQSLIIYCEQRGRIDELIQRAAVINPNLAWSAQHTGNKSLSVAQLAYVHEIALNTLKKSLSEEQAAQIANAFVGSLAAH